MIGPLAPAVRAFEWHSYEFPLPPDAVALARSSTCLQAFRIGESAWGIQFHAEVTGADARHWIDEYRSDPDAVKIGLDPAALRTETDRAIEGWNTVGRGSVRALSGRRPRSALRLRGDGAPRAPCRESRPCAA